MSRRLVYIIINGIKTDPGRIDGWTDRMVTALHITSEARAQAAEYHTGALNRRVGHWERVRKIAKMIGYYQRAGYVVSIIAHSNGAYVAADVLAARDRLADQETFSDPLLSLHLFAPAVDAELIADALDNDDVQRVRVCWSRNDKALKLGRWSRRLVGWIKIAGRPLGYGTLGLNPIPLQTGFPAVVTVERPDFDHSAWFAAANFDTTVRDILAFDSP